MEAVKNEIIFIYDIESYEDRKALGYAESLKDHKLRTIDITKDKVTETQLAEIAQKLEGGAQRLLNKQSETYQKKYEGEEFADDELLKVLSNDPSLLKTPIAIVGEKAHIVDSAYEFVNDDMANKTVPDDQGPVVNKREVDL